MFLSVFLSRKIYKIILSNTGRVRTEVFVGCIRCYLYNRMKFLNSAWYLTMSGDFIFFLFVFHVHILIASPHFLSHSIFHILNCASIPNHSMLWMSNAMDTVTVLIWVGIFCRTLVTISVHSVCICTSNSSKCPLHRTQCIALSSLIYVRCSFWKRFCFTDRICI